MYQLLQILKATQSSTRTGTEGQRHIEIVQSRAESGTIVVLAGDGVDHAIPHTADTLTVEWYAGGGGWEGGANESWGIDNVEVTLNELPVESTATFNVTLSHSSNDTISVYYTTVYDTAQAGSDYVAAAGTVTFVPGSTHETISVTVLGDTVAEGDETFEVALSFPINAAIGDAQGIATITDDDAAANLALALSHFFGFT